MYEEFYGHELANAQRPRAKLAPVGVNYIQLGIGVEGRCTTSDLNIKANTINNYMYGLITYPTVFGQEGDVGDIGHQSTQDNNNQFIGSYQNLYPNHTYRYWIGTPWQNNISTNSNLVNGSNVANGRYLTNGAPNPQTCETAGCTGVDPHVLVPNYDVQEAEAIADDQIIYSIAPSVSKWVAEYALYNDLERDTTLRNSSLVLSNFFYDRYNDPMGIFQRIEQNIANAIAFRSQGNESSFQQSIDVASFANNSITTFEPIEQHIKDMITLEIKVLKNNTNALTRTEIMDIETLANACPATEGVGVYKARMLNKYFHPLADYDDYLVCSPQNKNGSNFFSDLFNTMQNGGIGTNSSPLSSIKRSEATVLVYPVPTAGELNVISSTTEDIGEIEIHDLTGRILLSNEIKGRGIDNVLNVSQLNSGLYYYKVVFGSKFFTGKIEVAR